MESNRTTCVIVSYYNARPDNHLMQLLAHLQEFPAGVPFDVRVVVNRELPGDLNLPRRFANVGVSYRDNTGYNIGAWDHGWRIDPSYAYYVFLQDECVILRSHWLRRYLSRLRRKSCGIVGESVTMDVSWPDFGVYLGGLKEIYGDQEWLDVSRLLEFLGRHGVPPGGSARHLQALILAARREMLEASGGFLIGGDKAEAIAAEIAISRKVASLGFRVEQASFLPFTSIMHPQWASKRDAARSLRTVLRLAFERVMPPPLYHQVRRRFKKY